MYVILQGGYRGGDGGHSQTSGIRNQHAMLALDHAGVAEDSEGRRF